MTGLASWPLWEGLSNPDNPEAIWTFFVGWVIFGGLAAGWRYQIVHRERDPRWWRHLAWGVMVGGPVCLFWFYFLSGRIFSGVDGW